MGIGVNLSEPQEGFPAEIEHRAAALFEEGVSEEVSRGFAERVCDRMSSLLSEVEKLGKVPMARVREKMGTGGRVRLVETGDEATVQGITDDGALIVELLGGQTRTIVAGDVFPLEWGE